MRNKNAITIDRYIMKVKERKGNDPKFDVKNIKHIIIDESSMVTTELFYRLLQQLDSRVSFTFVGDTQQIQPIGWGSIMKELIASGRVPTFYLTKNQRIQMTSKDSSDSSDTISGEKIFDRAILENANNLVNPKRNLSTPLKFIQGSGFYILNGAKETVKNIVKALHAKDYKLSDFVIISPYKQPLDELNSIVQDIYLPPESTHRYVQPTANGGRTWAIGDKVMMIANNYKINVFNGDIGQVVGLDDSGVKVKFEDEAEHLFKFTKEGVADEDNLSDVDEKSSSDELFVNYLAHSFAMTSHKSQGSEYNFVILYLESKGFSGSFLNINLLYTSITRAKQTLWIVCDEPVLDRITITKSPVRYDGLSSMLLETKNSEREEILKPLTINPEFVTSLSSSTAITQLHDDFDDVDLYDLYDGEF
jgi:exodeoxyribonuclease V alpha subunit